MNNNALGVMIGVIVMLVLSSTVAVIGIKNVLGVKNIIRSETVPLAGERIETAAYAAKSLDKAEIEIKFKTKYKIEKTPDSKYLVFEYLGGESKYKFEQPVKFQVKEGESKKFCLKKDSSLKIMPGEC